MTEDRAPQPVKASEPIKVTAPKKADRKPRGTNTRKRSLTKRLDNLFTSIGAGVYMVNQPDGVAILKGSENLAKALDQLAKDNDSVYRSLDRLLTGSSYGGVIMALGGILLPIAENHNLLPFKIPGVDAPSLADIESMPEGLIPDIGQTNVANS